MNENIDQFGRTNKELEDRDTMDNKHTDQSKKIKDSLAEIKEQLINENFKIQLNENRSPLKETITSKVNSSSSKIKELEDKIYNIESEFKKEINNKLNSIEEKITNFNNYSHNEKKNLNNPKLENNIFFEIDNQLTPLTSNAVLVINKKNNKKKTKSPLIKIIYLIVICLLLFILSIFIIQSKNPDLNNLSTFGKEYLIKFLELIKYKQ